VPLPPAAAVLTSARNATPALRELTPASSDLTQPVAAPAPALASRSGTEIPGPPSGSVAPGVPALPDQPPGHSPGSGLGQGGGAPGRAAAAGGGDTSGAVREQVLARYLKGVRDLVARHREYPYLARRANLEGTICLRVSIGATGEVLTVTATCGNTTRPLLESALKSVSQAAPFPPLPPALGRQLTLDVPIVFDLDNM
jgi:periplasmic protein TonB